MNPTQTDANTLCRTCGLCCTGHLFIWSKLRSAEMDGFQALGVKVHRKPNQRGFYQPCPLWQGECTIYATPQYPRHCHTYKCKLLKKILEENIQLSDALVIIEETLEMIEELETYLPASSKISFRERLVSRLETETSDPVFELKAKSLLQYFEDHFGVKGF